MKRIALVTSMTAALTGTALADTADGPLFDTISMDRHTPSSTLNVDFGFVFFDEPDNTDFSALGITLGGQFVNAQSGLGVYGVLPISYISIEDRRPIVDADESELMIGNVELGGIFTKWMSPRWALVLHGGVALPTAEDDEVLSFAQVWASSPRYTDLVQRVPNSTWLRFGISPMGRSGGLFWRADFGIDVAIDEDNGNANIGPVLRTNVGGGIDLGSVQLLGEVAMNHIDDDAAASNDDSTGTFSIGARFASGGTAPGIAVILPIDFDGYFLVDPEIAIAATLAVRFR